jgi:hypothetical protein
MCIKISLQGGVARLMQAEPDGIYFRAGVVIAMKSSFTRIKNIYPIHKHFIML